MTGILETENTLAQPWAGDLFTTTRKAITALELASIAPTGWAMNPRDWEDFELAVFETGPYQLGTPGQDGGSQLPIDRARRRLYGLPVALTVGLPEGMAILADWAATARQWCWARAWTGPRTGTPRATKWGTLRAT